MSAPSPAERARTLLAERAHGMLATLTSDLMPFVAPVPFLADGAGNPVTVLPLLHEHVGHAWRAPGAGFHVGPLSLLGRVHDVPGGQQLDLQARYLDRHPGAAAAVESLDHAWLRLVVERARWEHPDGSATWIEVEDLRNAEPDPVAVHADELLSELAAWDGDDLLALARVAGGEPRAVSARPVGVDRYGLELAVTTAAGRAPARRRVPFAERLDGPVRARRELAALLGVARAAGTR